MIDISFTKIKFFFSLFVNSFIKIYIKEKHFKSAIELRNNDNNKTEWTKRNKNKIFTQNRIHPIRTKIKFLPLNIHIHTSLVSDETQRLRPFCLWHLSEKIKSKK